MQFWDIEEDSSSDEEEQQQQQTKQTASQTVTVVKRPSQSSNKQKRSTYSDAQQIDSFLVLVEKATLDDRFKRYIKSVVCDELFYRTFFDDVRLTNKIDYKMNSLKSDIRNDTERQTKLIVQSLIPALVPELVQTNVKLYLSSNVAREMANQLPNYLNNNHQMQQMLVDHQIRLEQALTLKLTELITNIVNDDQYHTVNRAYFDAFRHKGDSEINTFNVRGTNAVTVVRTNGETAIRELQARYENSFRQLNDNLNESNRLKTELADLRTKFNDHVNSTNNIMFVMGCVSAVALFVGVSRFVH